MLRDEQRSERVHTEDVFQRLGPEILELLFRGEARLVVENAGAVEEPVDPLDAISREVLGGSGDARFFGDVEGQGGELVPVLGL